MGLARPRGPSPGPYTGLSASLAFASGGPVTSLGPFLRASRRPARTLFLLQGELVDVAVAVAKLLGAACEVFHVPVVDLFRLDLDRLLLMRLEGLGPQIE